MENIIKKNGISIGTTLGIVLVLIIAIMYSIDLALFTNMWVGIINFILIIGFGIFCSIKCKKALNGQMNFKEAYSSFIFPVIIGLAIYVVFNILLFNVIDTEAKAVVTENVVKMTKDMMSKFGAPSADINKAITEIQSTDNFGPLMQIKSYFYNLIFYCVLGLLIALIFKTPTNKQ
jgi:tetrahydromethanopterin S-methyltransferase subunit F